ncbi:hypothetical protein [Flavihumibacter sp.]|uniref:hypothetical protein n=1 Tax=Flavihumibacter sp. TaxID=1913981 RepID=UPI002FC8BA22|nr:hypothetical protein [Flavihumibacter sediminis]
MKAGILYPRSSAHPELLPDFIDGIRQRLKFSGNENSIQLVMESIGFGGHEKEVYEKAEKLLVLEGVDFLVAHIDLRVLDILKPLVQSVGKSMLVVNGGANYLQQPIPESNIFYLTLNHAFLCWLSGKQLATEQGAAGIMATSFYDCGYLHTAAAVRGFTEKGGSIVFNYINKDKYNDTFSVQPLIEFLQEHPEAKRLLCIYDDLPASLFYNRLQQYPKAENLHLSASPMMFEKQALSTIENGFPFSISGYIPWSASSENGSNQQFCDYYQQEAKRPPSCFALLGWETGMVLEQILKEGKPGKEIEGSPRGSLLLDSSSHCYLSDLLHASLDSGSSVVNLKPVEINIADWNTFIGEAAGGLSSGWTNTYLCY